MMKLGAAAAVAAAPSMVMAEERIMDVGRLLRDRLATNYEQSLYNPK
jgi:hypothetical protein